MEDLEYFGTVNGKVVGLQYYRGMCKPGDNLLLRREPLNSFDRNAICVLNVEHVPVGFIPQTFAAKLALFMDRGAIRIKGMVAAPKGTYNMVIRLDVYGTGRQPQKTELTKALKDAHIPLKNAAEERARKEELLQREKEAEKLLKKSEGEL